MPRRSSSEAHVTRVSPRREGARVAVQRFNRALQGVARERIGAPASRDGIHDGGLSAMVRPFESFLEADPAARAARAKLQHRRFDGPSRLAKQTFGKGGPGPKTIPLALDASTTFLFPPYDWEWQWGNPQQALADKSTGWIGILGESGAVRGGTSDAVHAASGIGVVLTTDVPAAVSVRPFIQYSWEYVVGAYGLFSWGSAAGGLDAACFLDGQVIDGVHRSQVFSDSVGTSGQDRDDGDGIASVDDLTVSFFMDPGKLYAVPFGAWIDCDHASGVGVSAGAGKVQAQVKWIVVQRAA